MQADEIEEAGTAVAVERLALAGAED